MTNTTQMINANGNPVANHFIITDADGYTLQSYQSKVAHIDHTGNITLGSDWDYSATTIKHLKTFLGVTLSKKQMQERIDQGTIKYNPNM